MLGDETFGRVRDGGLDEDIDDMLDGGDDIYLCPLFLLDQLCRFGEANRMVGDQEGSRLVAGQSGRVML